MPDTVFSICWPKAKKLATYDAVQQAVVKQAAEINHLFDHPDSTNSAEQGLQARKGLVALCVMNGGMVYSGLLLPHLTMPVALDAIRVTRYRNQTTGGETLDWLTKPHTALKGQHVLLMDDIFDEGKTLEALAHWAMEQGAKSVFSAVMVDKDHDRKPENYRVNSAAMTVPDQYVFGMGMDYQGAWRNASGIWALDN